MQYGQNNVRKDLSLIGVIVIVTIFLLSRSIPENIPLSSSSRDSSNQTGISQFDINMKSDDILKAQILANSIEKSSEVSSTPNASLLDSTLETLHGIPDDADLVKRKVAQDTVSNYDDVQVIVFLMPNGDVYLEQPYSRQQNLTSNNLSFRDYYRGAVDTNSPLPWQRNKFCIFQSITGRYSSSTILSK